MCKAERKVRKWRIQMELTCLRSLALKEMGFIGRSMCGLVFFLVLIYIQANTQIVSVQFKYF